MTKLAGREPLYLQIESDLFGRICRGEFAEAAIPTEEALCADYGVSRITVRKALDGLIQRGLIHRRRGVGSFVSKPGAAMRDVRLTGRLDDLHPFNHRRLVTARKGRASAAVAAALDLPEGAAIREFRSVNDLDGAPIVFAEFYFPDYLGALLGRADFALPVSPLSLIEDRAGIRVALGRQAIEPAAIDAGRAVALGIAADTPVLRVVRTYLTADQAPVGLLVAWYHPERYRLTVELFPAGAAEDPKQRRRG